MRSASLSIPIANGMGTVPTNVKVNNVKLKLKTVALGSAKRAKRVVTLFIIIPPRSVSDCGCRYSHRLCLRPTKQRTTDRPTGARVAWVRAVIGKVR
jgi:hypothetical protein